MCWVNNHDCFSSSLGIKKAQVVFPLSLWTDPSVNTEMWVMGSLLVKVRNISLANSFCFVALPFDIGKNLVEVFMSVHGGNLSTCTSLTGSQLNKFLTSWFSRGRCVAAAGVALGFHCLWEVTIVLMVA